ncbi:MAG: helix-turn-helix domain-containing protein [Chitinivibrionales bacterium]|nr:helix-turn-helix domain-containing protein [Chitinivibrionales bacterium]
MKPAHMLEFRYLYHNRLTAGGGYRIERHAHLFWHVEFVTAGMLRVLVDDRPIDARPGEAVLLPPGVVHGFEYCGDATEVFSVKFSLGAGIGDGPLRAVLSNDARCALATLEVLLDTYRSPGPRITEALGHCVGAVVQQAFPWCGRPEGLASLSLVQRIEHDVRRADGRPLTVASVAADLGYSPVHVRTVYRRERGETLKRFIDRARVQTAIRYLGSTNLRVKEIAAAMGFSSQQDFARFCRRMTGVFPVRIRAQIRKGNSVQVE